MSKAPDQPAPRPDVSTLCTGAQRHRRNASNHELLWLSFKRLTAIGWPRNYPIVQFPNGPLIVAFLAGQAAMHTQASGHAYATAVSYLAMSIWAYEELAHGVNWFRHLLGLGYAISTAAHLAIALQN